MGIYEGPVTRISALLALLLLLAAGAPRSGGDNIAAVPFRAGDTRLCASDSLGTGCRRVELESLRFTTPETTLVRTVTVAPEALPLPRPLMVWIIATASSEIRWNGVVIGRNGQPGPDRARERPGRFIATFVVPARLLKPGRNVVSARLSAHRLWLPVHRPVHIFEVGPYETAALPGLASYLPALLAIGALAAAGIYFAAASMLDRRDRQAKLLAVIAALTTLQLIAEIARTFFAYTYPWHLARVMGIALLAGATAILVAAYAARRFAPAIERRVVLLTATPAGISIVLVPWFDLKALAAILAGIAALLVCARRGLSDGAPGARAALVGGIAMVALMAYQRTEFLDQAYYLAMAVLLVALIAEQVTHLGQARTGRDAEALRADELEDRLLHARRSATDPIVFLKDGVRTHRVAAADIVSIQAADDYCEVMLAGGRILLVTTTLARLHASLPETFVRVHKSHVVNTAHIATVLPRTGGGKTLLLEDGSSRPVGRTYGGVVERWMSAP